MEALNQGYGAEVGWNHRDETGVGTRKLVILGWLQSGSENPSVKFLNKAIRSGAKHLRIEHGD